MTQNGRLHDSRIVMVQCDERGSNHQKQVVTQMSAIENKLRGLVKAVGHEGEADKAIGIFRELQKAANLRPPEKEPRWSGVTDDSTPIEFSVRFRPGSTALRVLIEAQADPASPESYWRTGTTLTRWLARRWNAEISAALEIEKIFQPARNAGVHLAIGHGLEFRQENPVFKVYYNAMAQGIELTSSLVAEALSRLGFERSWKSVEDVLGPLDRIELLALDLTAKTRVKIYMRPLHANLRRLTHLYAISENSDASDVKRLWEAIHGSAKPEKMRPVFFTYQLTGPDGDRPSKTSLSIPLFPGIANDATASRLIARLMKSYGISPAIYQRCVKAMADRALSEEEGIHSYVSLQRTGHDVAIVTYFNPRLYYRKYGWIAREPERTWPSAVMPG